MGLFTHCQTTNENAHHQSKFSPTPTSKPLEKHKGAHVFGLVDSINVLSLKEHNIEWLTYVPFGSQRDYNSTDLSYHKQDTAYQTRVDSIWKAKIRIAHQAEMKVFLKPHIWLFEPSDSKWRSDIYPKSDSDWEAWKESYREFILRYAKIAEENKVELFCIGTELTRLSLEKPEFWIALIKEIKKVYKGKLTYAANWYEEYENITFWDNLDFIGVQAYFPLTKTKNPSIDNLSKGWYRFLPSLEKASQTFDRPILFTEIGYKSTANSAISPWEWIEYEKNYEGELSLETQSNCYQAFFDTVWNKKWFAGLHLWQMRSNLVNENHHELIKLDFTPQNKPAMKIIAKGFAQDN